MTDKKKRPDPESLAAEDKGANDIPNALDSTTTRPAGYWPALWRGEPKHAADLAKRCALFVALLDVALLALLALIVAEAVR